MTPQIVRTNYGRGRNGQSGQSGSINYGPTRPNPVRRGCNPVPPLENGWRDVVNPVPVPRAAFGVKIAEDVQLLVDGETIAQRVQGTTRIMRVPALLDQLDGNLVPASNGQSEGGSGGRGFESTLPCRVDALDALDLIGRQAAQWLAYIGRRTNGTTRADLRELVEAVDDLDVPDDDLPALAREVHRWATCARTVTGQDGRPWQPHVPCPECEELDTLKIKLAASTAYCAACHMTWDADDIADLAEQVRAGVSRSKTRECDLAHTMPKTLDVSTEKEDS